VHTITSPPSQIVIPYVEYQITSNTVQIPNPYFTIKSDGYYRDFKQSLTTTITPKISTSLLDFTIIQQQ
jgi:hypothetical protein